MKEELSQNGEWCMKKKKQWTKEEKEINKAKVGILIIMLGVEDVVLGASRKTLQTNQPTTMFGSSIQFILNNFPQLQSLHLQKK